MLETSRRNFFKLLGGGIACAVAPSIILSKATFEIPVEFGWTWHINKRDIPEFMYKKVANLMAQNTQKIYETTARDKHLLVELENTDIKLNLNYITEVEQNERMLLRMAERATQHQKRIVEGRANGYRLQEKIVTDSEINDKHLFKETRIKYWTGRVDQLKKSIERDSKVVSIDNNRYWHNALTHAKEKLRLANV